MKYLCLAYYVKTIRDDADATASAGDPCRPDDAALRESGQLLSIAALVGDTVVSIHPQQGSAKVEDAPLPASGSRIGACFVVEARDLNEALRIAARHPAATRNGGSGGGVEVRPIAHFEQRLVNERGEVTLGA